jgi:predicted MFS family arabinose efflux permease
VLTLLGLTTPPVLLLLIFSLGLGSALTAPAWQAVIPELVPREELPAAVSLNSVAFNIARAVGPAVGGMVVAAVGSWAVFLLNSLSFVGVLLVVYRWRREPEESISPGERMVGAMRAGARYVRHEPALRAVLLRTVVFVGCASALWATLPLVARQQLGLGAFGYGLLLGSLGGGAILGAFVLPAARRRVSLNAMIVCGSFAFAGATAALATVRSVPVLCAALVCGGVAWMAAMSGFNIVAQTSVPAWVRARALSIYLLAFFGSMAAGSAAWGALATRTGIPTALLAAAATLLVAGLVAAYTHPLRAGEELNLEPSLHWTDPVVVEEPHPEAGPVLVTIDYHIDPARAAEFVEAMREVRRILRRDGAMRWGLFADPAAPGHFVETFLVESWGEHMRQHARHTHEDRAAQQRTRSFQVGDDPPLVTHLVAQDFSKRVPRGAA